MSVVRQVLRDRCGKRVAVSAHDLEVLQGMKLLLGEGNEEISNIWKELCDRCPPIDDSRATSNKTQIQQQFVFNEVLKDNPKPDYDLCVAYSSNGDKIARYS